MVTKAVCKTELSNIDQPALALYPWVMQHKQSTAPKRGIITPTEYVLLPIDFNDFGITTTSVSKYLFQVRLCLNGTI